MAMNCRDAQAETLPPWEELEGRIGYSFRDRRLLETALTHTSFVNEHPTRDLSSNERLEFLGDAVLDLVISHLLMEAHPDKHEGILSRWRAAVVNEKALARKARDLTLGRFLRLGRGEERSRGKEKDSLLADAYEALLAAVYLDGGFEEAFRVIRRQFLRELEHPERAVPAEDFKTRLQEYTQSALKVTPRYHLISQEGPDHDKFFHVEVDVGEGLRARGSGRSKKEAEQRAARAMLQRLQGDSGSAARGRRRDEGP